jgi:transposase
MKHRLGKCQVFEIARGNKIETIKVLEKLIRKYPKNKRVCLIWDNASWHKSKELRESLKQGQSLERLHLINFPPYAPEHNPIEHVWRYAKEKIANRHETTFEQIKNNFISVINSKKFNYKI